jgi:branched-chain amino acid transport system substrate-binding protein
VKRLLCFAFAVALVVNVMSVVYAATLKEPTYTINAIIPATGGGSFLGQAYQDTFRAIENVVNASGGVQGHPLHIAMVDSQTNAQVGVQLLNSLIAQHVSVVIDGDPAAVCNAQVPIVAKTGPVLYCLSPLIYPANGSYVFSSSISGTAMANVGTRYFRGLNLKRLAIISSTDSTGEDLDRQMAAALGLPENRSVQVVDHEHFNPTDLSVAAQIARIKASNPQAVFVWSTGTSLATVFRALAESGLDVPVATAQSNLVYKQLGAYTSFLPKDLYFPTVLALSPESTLRGPLRDAQTMYTKAFREIGVKPDVANNLPWDPTMLIVDAVRHVGTGATAEQIRDYLLQLHGWVGVNGVYDFGAGDQRGIGESAAAVVKWEPSKGTWVRVSLPRGFVPQTARN